ncbi:DMT family transporter [Candidatus Gracilibacteria bacterium 28_42_T64]|nr:DMT family transporter [Candidatus Gracilibacteria bacterium 28_42_T64]
METIGFLLAILTAFSHSAKGIFQKTNLKNINSNTLVFILSGLSILFWFPFVLYIGIPEITGKLILVFIFSGILFYAGKLFSFKALQSEDISYISPLNGLITVGVLLLGFILLKETPNLFGILGVFIILFGVYFLNFQKYHTNFFEPIKHIFTNKGSQFFLITVVCYSFTNIFDKIGVLETYPIFWLFIMNIFLFFTSLFGFLKTYKKDIQYIKNSYLVLIGTFVFYAIGHIAQMTAIQYIFIGYMSAIKTAGMLFTIILGGIFFKESNLPRKFLIGIFIVLGVVLVYFGK